MDTRFHCVYLLTSLDPHCAGQFYIGYTVNPLRRLRQHNGELVNGARRTSRRGRPWTLVCCVSGFAEDRAALKFEWSWQHPNVSSRLKHTVPVALAGLRHLPYAVGTLHYLLRSDLFNRLELKLHVFERDAFDGAVAKAMAHVASRFGPGRRAVSPPLTASSQGEPHSPVPDETTALPALVPSHLFSIEVTTREAFEDTYLAHDRCLARQLAGAHSLQELSVLSCPYDMSVLSQTVLQDCSASSSVDHRSDDEEACQTLGWDAVSDDEGEREATAKTADERCCSDSPVPREISTPPRQACREEEEVDLLGPHVPSPLSAVVSQRGASTPAKTRPWPAKEQNGATAVAHAGTIIMTPLEQWCEANTPSRSRRRCVSAPQEFSPTSPQSQPIFPPLLSASAAEDGAPSVAAAAGAIAKGAVPTTARRLPRRFRHYKEADFIRDHAEEVVQLEAGILPCTLCALPLSAPYILRCTRAPFCALRCHLPCLALWAHVESSPALQHTAPPHATHSQAVPPTLTLTPCHPFCCPLCRVPLHWAALVKELKRRAVQHNALVTQRRRLQSQAVWDARLATMTAAHQQDQRRANGQRRARPPAPGAAATHYGHGAAKRARAETPPPQPSTSSAGGATGACVRDGTEMGVSLALTQFDSSEW